MWTNYRIQENKCIVIYSCLIRVSQQGGRRLMAPNGGTCFFILIVTSSALGELDDLPTALLWSNLDSCELYASFPVLTQHYCVQLSLQTWQQETKWAFRTLPKSWWERFRVLKMKAFRHIPERHHPIIFVIKVRLLEALFIIHLCIYLYIDKHDFRYLTGILFFLFLDDEMSE